MATEWAKYNIQTDTINSAYFAKAQTNPIYFEQYPFNDLAKFIIFLSSMAINFVINHILEVDKSLLAVKGNLKMKNQYLLRYNEHKIYSR